MKTFTALRNFAPLGLLVMLASCDRPHAPPPPTAAASPAAPSTVSLSGTILAPQTNSLPARTGKPGASKTALGRSSTRTAGSGGSGAGNRDNQALSDFQAEQEQRDRELLERDMDESRTTARDDRQPYDVPPEDGDWTSADDGMSPDDEIIDEPAMDDEPPLDDEPPADDRYYDPRDSGYRR